MAHEYCFGCMEEIDGYPCPHCGWSTAAESRPYALRPGSILKGRYLIGKVLGQGGFGITYLGLDLHLQRKLAIKEYYPSSYACRQDNLGTVHWYSKEVAQEARMSGREMFLKEARKMSQVSHIPEVVQVYDMFQENDTAYICMDFIDGITLMNRLKADGPMSWEEAKQIFLLAMTVLEQVHKAGLVHRDLSPDNIMIQRDGGIRILDLGAAKDLKVNSGLSSMQVAKSGFSPPEQYMQRGNSGSWTDVYAMAATMYYALTGKLPLPAMDRMNPEGDRLDWELPQLQALPKHALKALKYAMALRISDRTQTIEEFAKELTAEPVPKPVPKPGPDPEPNPEPIPTPQPTPKPKPKPIGTLIVVAALLLVIGGFLLKPLLFEKPLKPVSAALGLNYTILLMSDGTVKAFGNNQYGACDTSQWSDIVAISTEEMWATFGLKQDGTVVMASNRDKYDVSDWSDMVEIASGKDHVAGLKSDGTVAAAGENGNGQCDVSEWTDIVAIDAGYAHTVGLKADGTVVSTGNNYCGQCDVNSWQDIIAVSAGVFHTVGLQADGTCVAVGENLNRECDVSNWKNVIAVSAGYGYTLGLTSSGEVLATGNNAGRECDVSEWKNVVSISAGHHHTVGITADGQVLTTGNDKNGQCDIDLSK